MQPFSDTPDGHASHALHDTNELPAGTVALIITVAVAGNISLQMRGDSAPVVHGVGIGTHRLPGKYKLALSTGTTAVLIPTTTVIAQTYGARGDIA